MPYISNQQESKQLSLTLYNHGMGLVKELREMNLSDQDTEVYYLDVAKQIEIDSILIDGLDVKELNYEYDLVSKEKLLEKYLDQQIYIEDPETKERSEYRLLSVMDGIVVEKTSTREILINPEGEIILPSLPSGLIVKPGLVWKIHPTSQQQVKVSYLTKGFEWKANYVIHLKEQSLNLLGWVDINNRSGMTYEHAQLKLMAGDGDNISYKGRRNDFDRYAKKGRLSNDKSDESFEEQSFQDYHLYTFNGTTTLKDQQSKQINFLQKEQVPYLKYYEYSGYGQNAKIVLEFTNHEQSGLGVPLPKGKMKVYSEDAEDGSMEFIGENRIQHTPKNEKIKLEIGSAFDIKCESRQVKSVEVNGIQHETYEIEVRNNKAETALVKCNNRIHESNWKMVTSTDKYVEEDAQSITFWLEVGPEEKKVVEFTYCYQNVIQVEIVDGSKKKK